MKLARSPRSVAQINGRAVLQPAGNRNDLTVDPSRPLKKKSSSLLLPSTTPLPSPRLVPTNKRSKDPSSSLNSSTDKPRSPKPIAAVSAKMVGDLVRKKSKRNVGASDLINVNAPGSLAAAQKEKATMLQAKRKMKIAHYGRAVGKGERKVADPDVVVDSVVSSLASTPSSSPVTAISIGQEEEKKRCSFITPNSDPIYVRYHDEEWGVPVHDDKMLFELLVLSGAQVGLNWTTILEKRDAFRSAFSGFNAEAVSKLTEKQAASTSAEYGMELGRVRGIIDSSKIILKVTEEFGSLNKYIWGFVNNKAISPQYRSCRKIPVKTSKSEAISKDMVRRGFRLVGPTVIYSFMQAAGLTNDHILTCSRHSSVASSN